MNDKPVKAILDISSPVIVISEALMKELGLKVTGSSNLKVQTIANEKTKIIRKISNAPLVIVNIKTPIDIHVIKSDRKTLLVGIDWMEKYKADILLTKKIMAMEIDGQQYQTPITQKHRDVGLFYFELEEMYDEYNTSFLEIPE